MFDDSLGIRGKVPVRIFCSDEVTELLPTMYRGSGLPRFLRRYSAGNTSLKEVEDWISLISYDTFDCFKTMKDDTVFYKFALDNRLSLGKATDDIIMLSDSLECRAMLLEYKRAADGNGN